MDNFTDEDEESFKPKKGLNIPRSKNLPNPVVQKKNIETQFHNQVDEIEQNKKGYQSNLNSLSTEIIKIVQDKTLPKNKNNLQKDNEREVLNKTISLIKELDNDENEEINTGSISMITLLLALSLKQRDRLNEIEFEVSQLKASKDK